MGSANMDNMSFFYSSELSVRIASPRVAKDLRVRLFQVSYYLYLYLYLFYLYVDIYIYISRSKSHSLCLLTSMLSGIFFSFFSFLFFSIVRYIIFVLLLFIVVSSSSMLSYQATCSFFPDIHQHLSLTFVTNAYFLYFILYIYEGTSWTLLQTKHERQF